MPANTTQQYSSSSSTSATAATSGSFDQLPKFPLTCLQTADFVDTEKVVKGKNTVIGTYCVLYCYSSFIMYYSCYYDAAADVNVVHLCMALIAYYSQLGS